MSKPHFPGMCLLVLWSPWLLISPVNLFSVFLSQPLMMPNLGGEHGRIGRLFTEAIAEGLYPYLQV